MPPTSMTSESAATAPTMPSTEAITGGSGGGSLVGAALALGALGRQRFTHRAVVRGLAALDRRDGRAVEHGGGPRRAGRPVRVGDPGRDRQRVGGVRRSW